MHPQSASPRDDARPYLPAALPPARIGPGDRAPLATPWRRLLAHALLIAALILPARGAPAAPYQFTSADGGYSVTFPAGPQEQVNEDDKARTVLNALNHDNGYYAVVHVDNKVDLKLNDELEGNISKFTEQINAPTQLRRKKKVVRGSGDELPAEEFTFESEELVGKGIVIVEGRRTYMIAAFALKPHDRKAAVDRFIKSFKFQTAAASKPSSRRKPKAEDAAMRPKQQ